MSSGDSPNGGRETAWDEVAPLLNAPGAARLLAGRPVASVRRSAGAYSSSFSIEDVELLFADGTSAALVLKDLSPGALLDGARRAKPPFLLDPRREIETYRHVLGPYDVGAPAMLGAVVDEAGGPYLLLLEKVPGVPLWQVGEMSAWRAAAEWLAVTHRRLAADAAALAGPARLVRYDADYYARWRDRLVSALDPASGSTGSLPEAYAVVVRRLLELPATVAHGEFHASNVLVDPSRPGTRVWPVDWEMAALAPGLMDLADLTAGKWTEAERGEMAGAYRAAIGADSTAAGFEWDLDCCRLHRAVQWLSWSDDWTPPREHRQDWYAEAVAVAKRLGVLP